MAQAEALLRDRAARAPSAEIQRALETLRRLVAEFAGEMRMLYHRLDDIEVLLRGQQPAPRPPVEAQRPAAPPPAPAPTAAVEPPRPPAAPPVTPPVAPPETPAATANGAAASTPPAAPVGFLPQSGSVVLRVAPVSGFQGLMRVQDALLRLRGVREASVEAYAQGEARLRLQLSDTIVPAAVAAALRDALGQEASVLSASLPERSLRVALG